MQTRRDEDAARFDAAFQLDSDPWRYRTSWYEARKRALMVAALPRAKYRRGFEPACATGELSALLADRCDELLCADFAPRAVSLTRQRLDDWPAAQVETRAMPQDWPAGRFDLIVISEFAYYLDEARCRALARLACSSLDADGALLCCHWRHHADDFLITGNAVHSLFRESARAASLQHAVHVDDADFTLDVWCADQLSVAERASLMSRSRGENDAP
ncbi:SAM-dependent methyltransferase [Paraburkholderia tropica]|uniref:SAM-dependent methyltransferase n=1 Tax=Paraburkholderia tropica TaxID=92647 RepID=UPI0016225BD8|nr:SAM-dependent methyltransferase [Paraburkholderia tropica]MBB3004585.1 SAM-dependent methyltransferase [Paraburkholderia tropica]MBB6323634.1 SAM-dependent methyltransferase [Paraburkholderia tropica]